MFFSSFLFFLFARPALAAESEVIFVPTVHSLLVISSNAIAISESLSNATLNISSFSSSPSDSIFEELHLSQLDLIRETNVLRDLLRPQPPRSLRSRRSIWSWIGLASSSELSAVNQQLALSHKREGLVTGHLDLIDKTIASDHQLVRDLLLSEEKDFSALLDKIRRLSVLQAAAHLSSLVTACRERIRSLTDSFLTGHLTGYLAAPGHESIIISMGRRGAAMTTIVWSSTVSAHNLEVQRGPSCCSVCLNNTSRTIPCSSRILPLTSVEGPSHEAVCSVSPLDIAGALQKCSGSAFAPGWKPYCSVTSSISYGWEPASHLVPQLISDSLKKFHFENEDHIAKHHEHNLQVEPFLHKQNEPVGDIYLTRAEFLVFAMPIIVLIIISLTAQFLSFLLFCIFRRREKSRDVQRAERISLPPQQ